MARASSSSLMVAAVVAAFFLLSSGLAASTPIPRIPHSEPLTDITSPFYREMAEFAVREHNKGRPESEWLKLVSVDKGYNYPFMPDEAHFRLYITCSNSHGQAKYKTFVAQRLQMAGPNYFIFKSFSKVSN